MTVFKYTAKNMEGKMFRGTMDVPNENLLSKALREQGLYLVRAKSGEGRGAKKLTSKQLSEFNGELSNLLASGVSLVRALDIISNEEGVTPFARQVYTAVLAEVKKGVSLSEAMEQQGVFQELMLGMIRSGESNGNLDAVTGRLAIHYQKEAKLNQQVKSAMAYPLFLLVLCLVIVVVLVTFVLPQFEELFAEMETLPLPTVILMGVSDFLTESWLFVLLGTAALVIVFRLALGLPKVRRAIDSAKVHLPVIGKLNKIIYTARFARTMSSLYSSGMPIVAALKTAGETIGNKYVEDQFEEAGAKVRSGVALSEALGQIDGLLKKLSSTIFVGEESGRLDFMLDSIADSMEQEAQEATKRLVSLLEPLMIVLMAIVVGFVVVAVMLPIYASYGAIENSR